MAGRGSSHVRAPAVPVVSAAVGAVAGSKAIGDSRVSVPRGSVGPVVRGGVKGGVGLARALSDVGEPVSLVARVDLALAVTAILGRIMPENGGGGASCAFRRLITRAIVCTRRCWAFQESSAIVSQASWTERLSAAISCRSRRAAETALVAASGGKHGLGSAAMQATLPCMKSRSPVRLIRASTAIALEGSGSEGSSPGAGVAVVAVAARGRRSAEVPASAIRPVFVLLSTRAARRASLAREMESWAREAERAASSEAAAAAFEALSAVSEALVASAAVRAAADASCSGAVSACARWLAVVAEAAPKVSAAVKARSAATTSG